MPTSIWDEILSEDSQSPSAPTNIWDDILGVNNDSPSFGEPSDDGWVDMGIFERNISTGEMRLKKRDNALGGLVDNAFSRSIAGEDEIMDDLELSNLGREDAEGPLSWIGMDGNSLKRMGLDYILKPATGLASMTQDINAEIADTLGLDKIAEIERDARDESRSLSQDFALQSEMLMPPSRTGNPIKDIWEETKEAATQPSWENLGDAVKAYTGFVTHTAGPIAAAQALNIAAPGAGAVAIASLYGGMQMDDSYDAIRYDENGNVNTNVPINVAAGAAGLSAVASAFLEEKGWRGIYKDTGGNWIKGVLNAGASESTTEAAQGIVTKLIEDAPDFFAEVAFGPEDVSQKDFQAYVGQMAGKAFYDAVGGAIAGTAIRGATDVIAGHDERNLNSSTTIADLTRNNRLAAVGEMANLKMLLDAGGANALNWTPEHEAAVDVMLKRWGHVQEVSDTLKRIKDIKNDPLAAGREQALLDRASGQGVDMQDPTDPEEQAWNKLRTNRLGPDRVKSLNQWLQIKGPLSPQESRIVAAGEQAMDYSSLTPSDAELYMASLTKAREQSLDPEGRDMLNKAIGDALTTVEEIRKGPEAASLEAGFKGLWTSVNDAGQQEASAIAGLVESTLRTVEGLGYHTTEDGERAIMRVQNALSELVRQEGAPAQNAVVAAQSIAKLNQWLSPSNVALATEQYVDPMQVMVSMKENIDASTQPIKDESTKWESAIVVALSPQVAGEYGRNQDTMKDMALSMIGSTKPSWMTDNLYGRIKAASEASYEDHTQSEEQLRHIVPMIRQQAEKAADEVTSQVVETYRQGAREQAAKGTDGNVIIKNLTQEDKDIINIRKGAVAARNKAISTMRQKLANAFKQKDLTDKVREPSNAKDQKAGVYAIVDLDKYIQKLTDELSLNVMPQATAAVPSETTEAMDRLAEAPGFEAPSISSDVEEAMELLASQIETVIAAETTPEGMEEQVNKFLLRLGVLKPWAVNHQKPERESKFREFARITGRGQTSDWKETGAREASAHYEQSKSDIASGKSWDAKVASLIWRTVSFGDLQDIRTFVKESDHPAHAMSNSAYKGMLRLAGLGNRLVQSNPRGNMIHPNELKKAGSGVEPFDRTNIAAGISDSFRAANVLKRLFAGATAAKDNKGDNSFTDVINSLLDLKGSLGRRVRQARGIAMQAEREFKSIEGELRSESEDSLGDPSSELAPVGERYNPDWNPGFDDDVIEEGDLPEEDRRDRAEHPGEIRLDDIRVKKARPTRGDSRTVRDQENFEKWRTRSAPIRKEYEDLHRDANILRERELTQFFQVARSVGYRFRNESRIEQILSEPSLSPSGNDIRTDEKRQVLSYLSRINESVKAAVSQTSTPAGVALALKVNGYEDSDIALVLSLVDAMASKYQRQTGKDKWDVWANAAQAVLGHTKMTSRSVGQHYGASNLTFKGLLGGAFTRMKRGVVEFYNKLKDPSGRTNIYVPVHEFIHSLISSGYFREMLTDTDAKAIEGWIGGRLPSVRGGETFGKMLTMEQEEKIISAIHLATAVSDVDTTADLKNRAFLSMRENLFNTVSYLVGEKRPLAYSGVDMLNLQTGIDDTTRAALVSIFDIDSRKKMPAIYNVTKDGVILTSAHKLAGMVQSVAGVNISPYINGRFHGLGKRMQEESVLRSLLKVAASDRFTAEQFTEQAPNFRAFLQRMGTTYKLSDTLHKHLEMMYETLKEDAKQLDLWRKQVWSKDEPDFEFSDQMDSAAMAEEGMGISNPAKIESKLANEVLNTTTPLSNQNYKEITEPLVKLLGVMRPPILTGNANATGKNAQNIAVRSIEAMRDTDALGDLFESKTHSLEKLLLSHGLTREHLMVMNMGGLYAQARGQLENKVTVLEGDAGLGREKWRVINESLRDIMEEIPDSLQADVWSYLRARRELEIVENNLKYEEEYHRQILAHNANPNAVPFPVKKKLPTVNPQTHAAAVILSIAIDAKYGKDGGIVGDFAKRISKFENAAIAYKLHHYGMISEKEYRSLLNMGHWWMPQSQLIQLSEDLDGMEPYYNDGTKGALNNLVRDMGGLEHPLQEISKRVMATHLMTQRVWVRSALLKSLVKDPQTDAPLSTEDLKKIGIEPITQLVSRPASLEEWQKAPIDQKGPRIHHPDGTVGYSVRLDLPVTRAGFKRWASAHGPEAKLVYAIWDKGEATYYKITDVALRKAIDSLKMEDVPKWLKIFGKFTSILGRMITLAPKFIATMAGKDIGTATTRSRGGLNILTFPTDLATGLFQSLPYIWPSLGLRKPATFWAYNERVHSLSNQSSFAETLSPRGVNLNARMTKKGGVIRGILDDTANMFREPNSTKDIRDAAGFKIGLRRVWGKTRAAFGGVVEGLTRLGAFFDAGWRMKERMLLKQGNLSAYDRVRNARDRHKKDESNPYINAELNSPGYMSDLFVDAMDRQLTLDFARKGNAIKMWANLKMFAGPMFQDTTTTINMLADPLRRKSFIAKGVASMTLPALLLWAKWHDDDDWQRLSYWDKFNFIQLTKREDGTFLQLPAPIGLSAVLFKDTALTAAQMLSSEDPQAGHELGLQLLDQTPLQYQPFGQDRREWASRVMPTLAEGSMETAMNFNPLSNTPIDYDIGKKDAELPQDRGIEKFGIVESMLARFYDTSPRLAGYWLKQHLPGVAQPIYKMLNAGATELYHKAGGDPRVGSQVDTSWSFMWKWGSGEVYGPASLPVNRFYELYERARNARESIDQAYERGANEYAMKLEKDYPEADYAKGLFASTYGQIQSLKIQRGLFMKDLGGDIQPYRLEIQESYDKPMTMAAEDALREYQDMIDRLYTKPNN